MLAFAATGMLLTACDNDDEGIRVDAVIEDAFQSQYPGATRVEWEKKSGYYVADFRYENTEAEAWYDALGIWYMTETDVIYANLPQAVKTAFEGGDYALWRIDDIDKLEYPDVATVYIIEVEQGNAEYDLYYSEDGVLVKAVPDNDSGGYLPPTVLPAIQEYVAAEYPQARIVDVETERGMIEVDIVDGRTPRELMFTQAGVWVSTKTEVAQASVPENVMTALGETPYAGWHIDDVDYCETATVNYYQFELESGNQEVDLKIDVNGNVLP